jgi:hypothetical protein
MADNKSESATGNESSTERGLEPQQAPEATETVNPANDERSLDIGESGQFAPGGYYNQHGVTKADRLDLDEQTSSGLSGDSKK